VEREGIAHPELGRVPHEGFHDAALVPGRGNVGVEAVDPVAVRVPPSVEELARAGHAIEPVPTPLHPVELLQALDHVVGMPEAHTHGPPKLVQPPGALSLHQEGPHHACRPGREKGLERPADQPGIGPPFLLDQDIVEREVAVAS
jgi:hypothetical protein